MKLFNKISTVFGSIFKIASTQKVIQGSKYLYVFPDLYLSSEIKEDKIEFDFGINRSNSVPDIQSLYQHDFIIVLSEPGNGKSRLLKEITLKAQTYNFKSFFLDLKKIKKQDIEEEIKRYLLQQRPIPITNKEINSTYDYISSANFRLDSSASNILVCLDALDEVNRESQLDIIDKIKKFKHAFPKVHVVVSCRDYIYKKLDHTFNELKPKIVFVRPFSRSKVFEFLNKCGFSLGEIERVIEHFYRGFKINLIDNPRTLEIFASIKEKEGLEQALRKSKAELLEYFIYSGLDEEDKKLNKDQKEIIRRVLEILALTMEIYQANKITKDELMTFFDDINSNLAQSFLHQIKIEDFYERTLLFPVEDGNGIQFQNAEFQEYLAAKEISRLGKVEQSFYDLAVESSLREIYPSWSNTIKYLIDLVPTLQNSIVNFIIRKDNTIAFDILELITLNNEFKIAKFSEADRIIYFMLVLDSLSERDIYLSDSFAQILSLYYSNKIDLKEMLERQIRESNTIGICNALLISSHLHESSKLLDLDFWRTNYVVLLRHGSSHSSIKNISIRAIAKFNDLSLLRENFDYDSETASNLKYTFINSCKEIDSNDPFTIDLIIKAIKHDNLNIIPNPDFDSVTTKEALLYLLNRFEEDYYMLDNYSSYAFDKSNSEQLIENISKVYDKDIELVINKILTHERALIRNDSLLIRLIKLVESKNPNYIFQLVAFVKKDEIYKENWYSYNEIFEMLLTPENVEAFINEMKLIPDSTDALINLFFHFRNSSEHDKKEMFQISQKHFAAKYLEIEKIVAQNTEKHDRGPKIYDEFQYKLEPKKGEDVFITDIFQFYKLNKNIIDEFIQPAEKERLIHLIRVVLEYDFKDATIKITSVKNGTTSYSHSQSLAIFGSAIPLFKEMGITLEEYRKKLIEYLPYSFGSDDSKFILDLIPKIEQSEITYLIDFYKSSRVDDVIKTNVGNFYSACKKYNLVEAIPILREIVCSDSIEEYNRIEAIEIIHQLKGDFDFYQNIFQKYENATDQNLKHLAIKANEFLIQSEDPIKGEAIDWRINEILRNPISDESDEREDGFMSSHHIEFRTEKFNRPISDLSEEKYVEQILKMLDSSIDLLVKSNGFKSYVAHIWNIVMAYFENLKRYRSMNPVIVLEDYIIKLREFEGKNLLASRLNRVKYNYIKDLGKPSSYAECIKKYNDVKSNKYLAISSSFDLLNLVVAIIKTDLHKWITQEGAYDFSNYKAVSRTSSAVNPKSQLEELIQKTIKTQLENFLLKKGLRDNEIKIRREEQLLSDERTDFVVSYGFIGQILLEIKLANNPQANNKKEANSYKDKVIKYIEGTRSDYGVLLIFQTDNDVKWSQIEAMLLETYQDERKIKVLGLNCVVD